MKKGSIAEIQSRKRKIKLINDNLKSQINNSLQKIDYILRLKKNKLSNLNSNNITSINNTNLNNNFNVKEEQEFLPDLPLDQKLSIYKDSVFSLRKKLSSLDDMENILKLENEIKSNSIYLLNLKQKNNILKNENNNYNCQLNKIYQQNPIEPKVNEYLIKIENEKGLLNNIKNEYKEKYNKLMQQNNEINSILDLNYKYKENILIKKSKKNEPFDNKNLSNEINIILDQIKEKEKQIDYEIIQYNNCLTIQNSNINESTKANEKLEKMIKLQHIKNKILSFKKVKKDLTEKTNIKNKRSKSAFIGKLPYIQLPYLMNNINRNVSNNNLINGKRDSHVMFTDCNKNIFFPDHYKYRVKKYNKKLFTNNASFIESSENSCCSSKKKYSFSGCSNISRNSLTPIKIGNYNGIMNNYNAILSTNNNHHQYHYLNKYNV